MSSTLGGFSEVKPADAEIQMKADKVKAEVESKCGETFSEFKATQFRTQVVTGTNYLIKILVGSNKYVHVLVYETLPADGGNLEVTGVQKNKSKDDPLVPF